MTKDRESLTNSLPFYYVKNIILKTNTFTSEYLLTQPYGKNYFQHVRLP